MSDFSSVVDNGNNDAVEQLLMGCPRDAISILLDVLEEWKIHQAAVIEGLARGSERLGRPDNRPGLSLDGGGIQQHIYSVELDASFVEPAEPAFPFMCYRRAIAICTSSEVEEAGSGWLNLHDDLKMGTILYNLGFAYQLLGAEMSGQGPSVNRDLDQTVFDVYALALRTMDAQAPVAMAANENDCFRLLHMAMVNNILCLYARNADLTGMQVSLQVLRNSISNVGCSFLSEETRNDFDFFLCNSLTFPAADWQGLHLSPAA